MSQSPRPTEVERVLREDDFVVSKTDLQGHITYGNRIFIELSGYTEAELLGAPHSLIRHPDMPRGVFRLLWTEIQAGRETWAYVKNLARDGSFYWVLAHVTPSRDSQGHTIGYYSIRRRPDPRALRAVEPLYAAMRAAEAGKSPLEAASASFQVLQSHLAQVGLSYGEFLHTL